MSLRLNFPFTRDDKDNNNIYIFTMQRGEEAEE